MFWKQTIVKITKAIILNKKHQKTIKKSHVSRPQIKKIRKQTIGRIEKYFEWHFPIFQKLKNYPKNTNKPKFKKNQKGM